MSTIQMSLDDIGELARAAFSSNGCDSDNTAALVNTVVSAERDGSASHGIFRIPGYVTSLRSGKVNGLAKPRVERRPTAVIKVDGDNGFAPISLHNGVPALAEAAREVGIATMAVTNTYHFAALWPETEALAEQGLIGLACVCYMPFMAPHGGNQPLFGTNPISFSWPRPGKCPVTFDMATAAMAHGEVQIAAREGHDVPSGTGLDSNGQPTNDPAAILGGMLLPFGGHKGSAIALMVELLAAGAVGEQFSYEAAETDNRDGGPPRGGEFLLAISPELLAGQGWEDHCNRFFEQYESIDGARLPGTRRHVNRKSNEKREVNKDLIDQIRALCL